MSGRMALPKRYDIVDMRMHKGAPLLTLSGIVDRNMAESVRNQNILVPRSRLPRLEEDEIFMSQLPGLEVFTLDDKSVPLGIISAVDDTAGQEIWTITTPDGREVLFPVQQEFVVELDPDQGIAVISPPPGLLEIYLG